MSIKKIIITIALLAIPYALSPIPSYAVPGQLIYNTDTNSTEQQISCPPINCDVELLPVKAESEKKGALYNICLREKSRMEQQYALKMGELSQEKKKVFYMQILFVGILLCVFVLVISKLLKKRALQTG